MSGHSANPDPLAAYLAGTACPSWCERTEHPDAGHPYTYGLLEDPEDNPEAEAPPGQPEPYRRNHHRRLADLTAWDLSLSLDQTETTRDPAHPQATVHPPGVFLAAEHDHGADLGQPAGAATQLRTLARRLLDAADILDTLTAGRPQADGRTTSGDLS